MINARPDGSSKDGFSLIGINTNAGGAMLNRCLDVVADDPGSACLH
jgi:hypothetical protein